MSSSILRAYCLKLKDRFGYTVLRIWYVSSSILRAYCLKLKDSQVWIHSVKDLVCE